MPNRICQLPRIQWYQYCLNGGGRKHRGVTNTSDDRLKHNETDLKNGLDIIRQLKQPKYQKNETMKDANYHGILDEPFFVEAGFIAQEVLKISDISFSVTGGDY